MSYLYPDLYRTNTRGNYNTDFSNLKEGRTFPTNEVLARNRVYKHNMRLFTGEYAKDKYLTALIDNHYQYINYRVLPLNYFKLMVDKIDSLLFNNGLSVRTGDTETDKIVANLIDKVGWEKGIREAVRLCEIYGDACIKTYRNGVSAFSPLFAYKVVDASNKDETKGYVLHELLYDEVQYNNNEEPSYEPKYIRILISCSGYDYERVYEYTGSNSVGELGRPVRYKYKNRWIPKRGRVYHTDINDCESVQWLSINKTDDGVYGTSSFNQVKDIIFAIEARLSQENWVIDAHGKPLLIAGMSCFKTDEVTGQYYLSTIDGKYLVDKGGTDTKPEYLTWDGKLEASKQVRDDLMSSFYELSEMGKTFLSGEYVGNISEESLNNIIKSAIDRGNREVNDIIRAIKKSLYFLCRLNGINVKLEDINVIFNVGRIDDAKTIADTCKTLIETNMFSNSTLLQMLYGYTQEDAEAEAEKVKAEKQGGMTSES